MTDYCPCSTKCLQNCIHVLSSYNTLVKLWLRVWEKPLKVFHHCLQWQWCDLAMDSHENSLFVVPLWLESVWLCFSLLLGPTSSYWVNILQSLGKGLCPRLPQIWIITPLNLFAIFVLTANLWIQVTHGISSKVFHDVIFWPIEVWYGSVMPFTPRVRRRMC